MDRFNVIWFDPTSRKFKEYDVMPYLADEYGRAKKKPKILEEFKEFVRSRSMRQWWGRCEYEIVLHSWPEGRAEEKVDIHRQVMMNLDLVARLLMEGVKS